MSKECNTLQNQAWFEELVENLGNLLIEGEFTARYTLIQTYHTTGAAIAEHEDKDPDIIKHLAKALNKSTRLIYQCRQFYAKIPDLKKLPGDKTITWRDIVTNILPEHKEKKEPLTLDERIAEFFKEQSFTAKQKEFARIVIEEWELWRK